MPSKARGGLPELNASSRRIVALLLHSGPLPRVELARRLALTPASLSKLTRPMLDMGLFEQVELSGSATTGRPVQPLSVNPRWTSFVGVKLTGDWLFAVRTDLAGRVLEDLDRPLQDRTVAGAREQIVAAVNDLCRPVRPAAVGIGVAGPVIRARGHVVASPFLGWTDVDLAADVERRLQVPVVVENDLRALTTDQHWFDDSLTSFALVTFGAGIGCGLVLDDRLINGSGGAAGFVDHLRIDDHGPICARGHRGCVSGYATTAGILRAVSAMVTDGTAPRTLVDVANLARNGGRGATEILRAAGYAVGCVVGTICNIAGPARVIISGEGVDVLEFLEDALHQGISDVTHPALPPVPVTVTPLSFTDWARGSAVVAIQHHLDVRPSAA